MQCPTTPFPFDLIELFFPRLRERVQSEVKFGPRNLWLRGPKALRRSEGRAEITMLENEPVTGTEGGLKRWLEGIGLGQYSDLFAQHRLDLDVMGDLTESDLV